MAQRATSLGPKPSLFVFSCFWLVLFLFVFFCFVFVFYVLFCFLIFLTGFKGQVRLPEGPPHLALNPPYLFFCLLFPKEQKTLDSFLPLKRGIFAHFLNV